MILLLIQSALLGVAVGIVYDWFRILRQLHDFRKASVVLLDLLFFFCAAVMTLLFSVAVGQGQLRFFLLVAALLGVWLYAQSFSPLVVLLGTWIGHQLYRMVATIHRIALAPLMRLFRFFKQHLDTMLASISASIKISRKKKKDLTSTHNTI